MILFNGLPELGLASNRTMLDEFIELKNEILLEVFVGSWSVQPKRKIGEKRFYVYNSKTINFS